MLWTNATRMVDSQPCSVLLLSDRCSCIQDVFEFYINTSLIARQIYKSAVQKKEKRQKKNTEKEKKED